MKKKTLLSVLFTSSLIIASCGGGSSSSSGGGGSTNTPTYLAYKGSINLVDPDNPQNPILISPKPVNDFETLFAANYNSSNHSYSDLHRHSIYWIEKDDGDLTTQNGGKIYKLSMVKSSSIPSPIQLSNLINACSFENSEDDIVNRKIYMVVRTAGNDGKCSTSDDEKYFINSDMSSTDTAISMNGKDILTSISGGMSNPTINGFLVNDLANSKIQKCDTNLSNCIDVANYTSSVSYLEDNISNGDNYLCVDGTLKKFDGTSLSAVGSIDCRQFGDVIADDTALYAEVNGNIIKIPFSSTTQTTIYNGGNIQEIYTTTNNYLIAKANTDVIAIKKDGTGTPITITDNVTFGIATADKYYFTYVDFLSPPVTIKACEWIEGTSNPNCIDNSMYIGFSFATSGNLKTYGKVILPIYRLLRIDDLNISSYPITGGTVKAVNPVNNTTLDLGNFPSSYGIVQGGFGIGNYMLLTGYNSKGNKDVFFINLSQQGSLQKITDTTDKNEYSIF